MTTRKRKRDYQLANITVSKPSKEGNDRQDDENVDLEDTERASRTLFVGNLSVQATRKSVKKLFSRYGTVESVRLRGAIAENPRLSKRVAVISRRMAPGCETILAFVVFEARQDDLEKKMKRAQDELNLTMFKEKLLIVNPANFKRARATHSMFVGNMPFDVTVEEVVKVFRDATEDCGSKVVNVVLHKKDCGKTSENDGASGGPMKGSGYVVFDDVIGVTTAMNLEGEIKIRGRVLRMQPPSKSKRDKKQMRKENIRLEKKEKRRQRRRMEREAKEKEEAENSLNAGTDTSISKEQHGNSEAKKDLGVTKSIRKIRSERKRKKSDTKRNK
eukprot:Plantae.Rhodophyta-Hildenbrandia_rubra.ctg3051.p1 GENE.Plantae.Rhodophyta-Hildenbrandia_rubra.ctg3051~~Plantae.Rhodophyta-Hildenbrandia_rubra.ctg3051.p1  ORF type:complete len:331 (+),score=71.73 Plantae.Rhodophyta-Hildenbrandia_rubra.ctg3051:37-1029(+)